MLLKARAGSARDAGAPRQGLRLLARLLGPLHSQPRRRAGLRTADTRLRRVMPRSLQPAPPKARTEPAAEE